MSDKLIYSLVSEGLNVKAKFFNTNATTITYVAREMVHAIKKGHKILLFGNGGSAADAQHIAAELVGRFKKDRKALPAIALTTDTSILTAIANDYGYAHVFSRQLDALCTPGDIIIGISTSGNSPNVVRALQKGTHELFNMTIAFTGEDGGDAEKAATLTFKVPSKNTPRIQETHLMLGHVLCELVDRECFPELYQES